jgi:hypothetical protein
MQTTLTRKVQGCRSVGPQEPTKEQTERISSLALMNELREERPPNQPGGSACPRRVDGGRCRVPYDLEAGCTACGCVAEHADVLGPLQAGEAGAVVDRPL